MMSRALRPDDVLELSRIYEPEYNKPELHDRVLVFDVMRDGWEKTSAMILSSFNETREASKISEEKKPEDVDSAELLETHSHEKAESARETKKEDPGEDNVSSENESEIESDTGSLFCRVGDSGCTETNLVEHPAGENKTETSILSKPASDPSNIDILKQHKFFVHGSWLALQSSYFRSLFFSGMKESNSKEVHVKISQSEEKAHLQLLEAMYKVDTLDNVDVDELLIVLELAHKYDAKFAFRKCKYALQATELSLQTCEKIMCFIKIEHNMTDVEDLAATLQTFLAHEFSPLDKTWQTTSFGNLSQTSLKYLLSSNELITQSENTVFHALMHWLQFNELVPTSSDQQTPLLSVIRFELMPVDYLYNVVQHHPIAAKMADFNRLYLNGVTYHALTSEIKERLTVKPIKRTAISEDIVQYTWNILNNKIEESVSTQEELKSDEFWCCGYKMQLSLANVSLKGQDHNSRRKYTGNLGLQTNELASESAFRVEWTSTGKTFSKKLLQHTFSADSMKSCLCLNFTLDSDRVNTTMSSGFTFGTQTAAPSFGGLNFGGSLTATGLFSSSPAMEVTPVTPSLTIDVAVKVR